MKPNSFRFFYRLVGLSDDNSGYEPLASSDSVPVTRDAASDPPMSRIHASSSSKIALVSRMDHTRLPEVSVPPNLAPWGETDGNYERTTFIVSNVEARISIRALV